MGAWVRQFYEELQNNDFKEFLLVNIYQTYFTNLFFLNHVNTLIFTMCLGILNTLLICISFYRECTLCLNPLQLAPLLLPKGSNSKLHRNFISWQYSVMTLTQYCIILPMKWPLNTENWDVNYLKTRMDAPWNTQM